MRIRFRGLTRGIRAKLLASYFVLLLPLIAFGALWMDRLVDEERHLALTSIEDKATHLTSHFASVVETVEAILSTIAEVPEVRDVKGEAGPLLASVLDLNPNINNLYVLDSSGRRVAVASTSSQMADSFADRGFFREVTRTGKTAVGEVVIAAGGRARGQPVIHIAVPLKDSTGQMVGVVAASLPLEKLARTAGLTKEESGSYVYAVDGTGKVIAHPDAKLVQSLQNLGDVSPVKAVLKGEAGVTEFVDPSDGQGYLAVFNPVPSTPWGTVAVYPLSRLNANRQSSLVAGGVSVALSSLFALLLATLLARPVVVSLGQLVAATQAMREGRLGATVDIKRRDEIGELAQAFNTMSFDLAETVKKLDESRRQLEKAYREVGEALTSGFDLNRILEVALQSATGQLGLSGALIGLLDQGGNRLEWAAATGCASAVEAGSTIDLTDAHPAVVQAVTSLKPVTMAKNGAWLQDGALPDVAAALPLLSRGRCLGVFILCNENGGPGLSGDELDSARSFAGQVAVAIDNVRAHAEVERLLDQLRISYDQMAVQNEELQAQNEEIQAQNEELQAQDEEIQAQGEELKTTIVELQAKNAELDRLRAEAESDVARLSAIGEVSVAIGSSLDLNEVCQKAVESTVHVIGSRVGALRIANWEDCTLELRAAVGASEDYRRDFAVVPINDQSLGGKAVQTLEPQFLEADKPLSITRELVGILDVNTYVVVPIVCKGKALGVMSVSGPHDRHATRDEVSLLMTIANQIGVAIENASLYSRVTEVDKLKDEFMSVASHELKSPLTSIKGYAQLLLRRAQNTHANEVDLRGLHIINEQIDRMTRLVNDLLDVSRIESGHFELQRQSVDLGPLMTKLVDSVQITTEKHHLKLELPPASLVGVCDEWRVEQVLQNLLSNAVKYSPRGGVVRIRAAVTGSEVEISVQDEGMGIPKSCLPNVFDRFFQASNVERANYGGLGLGLYVSHQIVLGHGGRMWAESDEGKGSTFYFTLPLAP